MLQSHPGKPILEPTGVPPVFRAGNHTAVRTVVRTPAFSSRADGTTDVLEVLLGRDSLPAIRQFRAERISSRTRETVTRSTIRVENV